MQGQFIQTKPQIITAKIAISCEARNPVESSNEYLESVKSVWFSPKILFNESQMNSLQVASESSNNSRLIKAPTTRISMNPSNTNFP